MTTVYSNNNNNNRRKQTPPPPEKMVMMMMMTRRLGILQQRGRLNSFSPQRRTENKTNMTTAQCNLQRCCSEEEEEEEVVEEMEIYCSPFCIINKGAK